MSSSELLDVEGLSCAWDGVPVVENVGFRVAEGEFVVLLGPNGSGKTTLLRSLAGLEPIQSGSIRLRGRSIETVPAHRRGIGMLFQEPALFLQRTVYENVIYGLEIARLPRAEVDRRASELLALLHLQGFEDRKASALSGGERQRVALARTLAPRPAIVLLDEPFASVDPELRTELMSEFREVLRRLETAAIHVTHDREEGLFLGDRVLVLIAGRLRQEGVPDALYHHPRSVEVARFLGYNIVPAEDGWVAVHPRSVTLGVPGSGHLDARVVSAGSNGTETVVFVRGPGELRIEARAPEGRPRFSPGATVGVGWTSAIPLEASGPPG